MKTEINNRVGRRIKVREVRVIDQNGAQLGVLPTEIALRKAEEAGLDLVEVSPQAKPPVCKIMNYGKYKYELNKKPKQHAPKLKEMQFRPAIDDHDYEFKVRAIKEFLEHKSKVRVVVTFKGREISHRDLGQAILTRVGNDLKEIGNVEQAPKLEGKNLFMLMAPKPS